jgi:hypothetical protein
MLRYSFLRPTMKWSGYTTAPAEAGLSPREGALYCSRVIHHPTGNSQIVKAVYDPVWFDLGDMVPNNHLASSEINQQHLPSQ